MGKITKQEILKINNKCFNDWSLDVEFFIYYNQKTLIKQIQIDEENYLEFTLRYNCNKKISLHISKYYHKKNENYASTSGLGKSKILDETPAKIRNVNKLIELTKTLNDEELLKINENTQVIKSGGLFIASEEF